jgi:uncharacterized protein YjfI (DUF2170 family)
VNLKEILEANGDIIVSVDDGITTAVVRLREEFPIAITSNEDEIRCSTNLWTTTDVEDGKIEIMMESMLAMNIALPLSTFAKIGDQFILTGSLSATSKEENIVKEVLELSDNTLESIEALKKYLK